jgi:ssDNA-binding Zn-finger/Zn-ribbon topoisomerase 1
LTGTDGYEMDGQSVNRDCSMVCKLPDQKDFNQNERKFDIECERCGRFKCAFESSYELKDLSDDKRPIISEWIYEQNELGIVPVILPTNISALLSRHRLTFRERARRLLIYLSKQNQLPGVDLGHT